MKISRDDYKELIKAQETLEILKNVVKNDQYVNRQDVANILDIDLVDKKQE